jgi:hypothetical protein
MLTKWGGNFQLPEGVIFTLPVTEGIINEHDRETLHSKACAADVKLQVGKPLDARKAKINIDSANAILMSVYDTETCILDF